MWSSKSQSPMSNFHVLFKKHAKVMLIKTCNVYVVHTSYNFIKVTSTIQYLHIKNNYLRDCPNTYLHMSRNKVAFLLSDSAVLHHALPPCGRQIEQDSLRCRVHQIHHKYRKTNEEQELCGCYAEKYELRKLNAI